MIALFIAFTVVIAGLSAALVWAVREARAEGKLAVASARKALEADGRAAKAIAERDAAVMARAALADELHDERAAHRETAQLYTAAVEVLSERREKGIVDADADDVAPAVVRMLKARIAEQARAAAPATDRGGAASPVAPGV